MATITTAHSPAGLDATCTTEGFHVHVIAFVDGDAEAPAAHEVVTDGTHMHVRDTLAREYGEVEMVRRNTGAPHRQHH